MWHLSSFQPQEIIDLAVEIEKEGAEFYKSLAARTNNSQVKELLLFLAAEEAKHQLRFKELGQGLVPANTSESYPGEYLEYVGGIVETHMFNDSDKLARIVEEANSELDILSLAMNFEKDSVMFFQGFKGLLDKTKRGIVDDLIMEEQIHMVKLLRLKKNFK